MSVATSTRISPDLKSASARVRAPCDLLPWIAALRMPSLLSCSARWLAPCLVRVNQHLLPVPFPNHVRQQFAFAFLIDKVNVLGHLIRRGIAACHFDFQRVVQQFFRRALISSEKVAENNRFWRFAGSFVNTRRISWIKPMSSMRSASSRTRIST